jgi:serine/threonine protein kinase
MALVMPKLDFSLADQLIKYPFIDLMSVQKLVVQMLMGIRDIHQTGVTHCDLKPENIMFLIRKGRKSLVYLKFIDFGSVQEIGEPMISTGYRKPKGA